MIGNPARYHRGPIPNYTNYQGVLIMRGKVQVLITKRRQRIELTQWDLVPYTDILLQIETLWQPRRRADGFRVGLKAYVAGVTL